MGRAGQQVVWDEGGLQDRISVGLLARAFSRARVEAVIEASGAREQRVRMLPSWLVVYYVLALALFMDIRTPDMASEFLCGQGRVLTL